MVGNCRTDERCCGNCCWFCFEQTDGDGQCMNCPKDSDDLPWKNCSDELNCERYVSRREMRHHMAVLVQHNRWRRSNEVPNHCRMVNPTELGEAIDFSLKYMKVFSKL